jgi:hypothetical protein
MALWVLAGMALAVTGDDAHTTDHTTARSMAGLILRKRLNVSCFNGSKAHILLTHYTNGPLVVYKSAFYAFRSKSTTGFSCAPL